MVISEETRLDIFDRLPDLDDRISLIVACNQSELYRNKAKEAAKNDVAWFCNAFCYTMDPREEISDLPFFLYPFQVDFMEWLDNSIHNKKDGLVEKSRDMGITWSYLVYIVHSWLFKPGFHALLGSRKEEMVDNFTEKSLFGRLEYIISKLPGWLLPRGFSLKKHRRERRIMNPENGNEITGEATNKDFGRQGRYTMVVFDEAAMWDNLHLSWGSASGSTPTRIAVSTPNREHPQNYFYKLRSEVVQNVQTIKWHMHPLHDEAWYEALPERLTQEEIDHEVDISYQVTRSGLVYPQWKDVPKGDYPYVPGWELFTSWDFGIRDTSIIWWQRNPVTGEIRMIDAYQGHNQPIDFYVPFITGTLPSETIHEYSPEELRKITEHGSWGVPINYGDPAGSQRSATDGVSVIDILAEHQVYIFTNTKSRDHLTLKDKTTMGLRDLKVNISTCSTVDSAMLNARYPDNNPNSSRVTEVKKPIHDWTSHFRTSIEFFFVNLPVRRGNVANKPAVKQKTRAYQTLTSRRRRR